MSVKGRFDEQQVGDIGVSSITVAELSFGVHKSKERKRNHKALMQFLAPLFIAEFDTNAAFSYGTIRAELERQGTPIRSLDTLIASHALSLGTTLVTNNEREFARVPGLSVENWVND